MFLIGLTGGIASGKSTVLSMLSSHGFPVVDADLISRRVVEPGRKAWKKLKVAFGDEIFLEDGNLNREKLAEIIFADKVKRRKLNEITHPDIIYEMIVDALKLGLKGHSCVVMDIPLLYESGDLVRFMHKIVVVRCEGNQQVERLLGRTKMTEEQAKLRVAAQMPLDEKAERADFVIDNTQDVTNTRRQVDKLVSDLRRSRFHWTIRLYLFLTVTIFSISTGALAYYFFGRNSSFS